MPLLKGYDGSDGYYYIEFALSTTDVDLENEQVTPECLDDMIQQAKSLNSFQCHQYGLDDILGPIVDAWKDANAMFIKVRIIPSFKQKIKELIDSGVKLGGSIGALYVEDSINGEGVRLLQKVKLLEGSLTPLPANWSTLGTAEEAKKSFKTCKNGLCKQIFKSLNRKYNPKMEVKDTTKTESESYETLRTNIWKAIRNKYSSKTKSDGLYSGIWSMLTFKDSVIVETWDDSLYEIPYTVKDDDSIDLGDPIDVDRQYVTKKLEIFGIKDFSVDEGHNPEDSILYTIKKLSEEDFEMLDDKSLKQIIDAQKEANKESNQELLDGMKSIFAPPQEGGTEGATEGPGATPAPAEVDVGALTVEVTDNVTKNILKALGLEVEEPEPEEQKGGENVVVDAKSFTDMVTKNVLKNIRNERQHTRKSIPAGHADKFAGINGINGGSTKGKEPEENNNGKVSTRKAAEMICRKKGLIN